MREKQENTITHTDTHAHTICASTLGRLDYELSKAASDRN
jgi:hypothetical protein